MTTTISLQHKQLFEEMKKNLTAIGSKEGNFIKVELMFYQAMTVAREYGDDEKENGLLAALKNLQANQYQETKAFFKKNTQREKVIRKFANSFKSVLTAAMKNEYLQPQLA